MSKIESASELGRLSRLQISGLLGSNSKTIDLAEAAPTVLTGRNGSGKSTILRCIDAIGRADWYALRRLPFSEASLEFEHGTRVQVIRENDSLSISLGRKSWTPPFDEIDDFATYLMDEDSVFMTEADLRRQFIRHGGEPPLKAINNAMEKQAPWLSKFISDFEVLFITDQRLVIEERHARPAPRRPDRPIPTTAAVELSAKSIARQIQASLSNYATHSQELDRRFPGRVVKAMQGGAKVDLEGLSRSLEGLSSARKRMQDVGLLPKEELPFGPDLDPRALQDDRVRTVIETYVKDTQDKLQVLEGLQRRLSLLTSFLNGHYVDKRVEVDAEQGLALRTSDGRGPLELTDLSSGEQQMLVLAFEILFRARHGTLLLIDEPELSLHVLWQDTLIDDLADMGAVQDVQFIMATHSPTLLGGRLELQRSLDAEG